MGGHVESGETYEESFKRELMEELSIDADKTPWKFLAHLTPKKNQVYAFMNVYEIVSDETPKFNKSDFTEYYWLTPNDLFTKIKQGEKTKGDLPTLVNLFYWN